jgi:hypothetical protein
MENLKGNPFGRLVVLYQVQQLSKTNRCTRWLCECQCKTEDKNTLEVDSKRLRSGHTKSCGCLRIEIGKSKFKDLTEGDGKFGSWKVIKFAGRKGKGQIAYWTCQCDCGFITDIVGTSLTNGSSTRCRTCSNIKNNQNPEKIEKVRAIKLANSQRNPFYVMLKQAESKLKRGSRVLEFNVSVDYITKLFYEQKGQCALSGREISLAKEHFWHKNGGTTASLDRINSSKGYIEGNLQWVHKDFQFMKSDLGQQEFLDMCVEVAKHQGHPQ